MLLVIDNYDSFTFNLVQHFRVLGVEVLVRRNDAIGLAEVLRLRPRGIVISPGPGTPDEAGISLPLLKRFAGRIPMLGVCLGHQAIGRAFGAEVVRAERPQHGKVARVQHDARGVLSGLPNPFQATRYHSLVLSRRNLPDALEISAWVADAQGDAREIMGIRHREYAVEGVQFHPESILTPEGMHLLENFLKLA